MADLTVIEKRKLEILLKMEDGRVLNFTQLRFYDFFKELGVPTHNEQGLDHFKYGDAALDAHLNTSSPEGALRVFFSRGNNKLVGNAILKLIEYIENEISYGELEKNDFPPKLIVDAKNIAYRLLGRPLIAKQSQAVYSDNEVNIILQEEIFNGVQEFLNYDLYYSAVEEAYKIVREKLRDITGEEKATNAFNDTNLEKIFGVPKDQREEDFIQGVKFLHTAIQFFRNEKVHSPATKMEKNQALHYIALASLGYQLISDKNQSPK